MELQGKECSPACRESRVLLAPRPLSYLFLRLVWCLLLSALLVRLLSLCRLAFSAPSPHGPVMAAIALVPKNFWFMNIKGLSLKFLSLCGPPSYSHLCPERGGLMGRYPLSGGNKKRLREHGRFHKKVVWGSGGDTGLRQKSHSGNIDAHSFSQGISCPYVMLNYFVSSASPLSAAPNYGLVPASWSS